jgi:1-acyl-sn-glycerol-3-phosphate acyltransferase
MRAFFKAVFIFLGIIIFIGLLAAARCVFAFAPKKRAYYVSYMLHAFHKTLVWILGIKVDLLVEPEEFPGKGNFFVSNHFSYIDGIVTGSAIPFIFIGKSELKNWPLLGVMIWLSETVFINRIDIFNIQKELKRVTNLLDNDVNVMLFPEGTSSDGKKAIAFKPSFFAAPLQSKCHVVPVVIKYKKINGRCVDETNKDAVYWYGDMDFFPHFVHVLGLRSIEVELKINRPLPLSESQDMNVSTQRKHLSNLAQEVIHGQLAQVKR